VGDRVAVALETAVLYMAEAHARASLRNIIDQLPEAVVVLDDRGIVTAVNRVAVALLPQTADVDEWDALDARTLDGHPVAFAELPIIRALRSGETVRDAELLLRTSGRRALPITATARPLRHDPPPA